MRLQEAISTNYSKKALNIFLVLLLSITASMFFQGEIQAESDNGYTTDFEEKQERHSGTFFIAGSEQEKKTALSFDDGPSSDYTPLILDILKEYDIKATFFLLGKQVEKHPELVQRIAREGHSIGNHSHSHRNFTRLDWETVRKQEIERTGKLIEGLTGQSPELVRPPYGKITEEQIILLSELGYKVINWSVDTKDWREDNNHPGMLLTRTRLKVHPGAIILMHDGGGDRSHTVEFLPELIKMLQNKGYDLTTVDDMLSFSLSSDI